MKAIALTGSIASGKTTVLKFVRSSRVPTVDCDAIVRKLYKQRRVQQKLLALFGTASRKKVAGIVFSSTAKRKQLERFLHPLVWKQVKARLASFRKQGRQLAIVDVPLLFEARWQNRFNAVIFVKAPKKVCVSRLICRGLTRKEALQRWDALLSPKKKIKKALHVINNGGRVASTKRQVRQLLAELR